MWPFAKSERFENGLKGRKFRFELPPGSAPPEQAGVLFHTATISESVGMEVVAFLCEPTDFVAQLIAKRPLELRLNTGAVKTDAGQIVFLHWWVPPIVDGAPFAFYEQLLNVGGETVLYLLDRLSRQSHLHVVLVGSGGKLLDVVEFENNFEFDRLAQLVATLRPGHENMDFTAAQHEFFATYDQQELFAMSAKAAGGSAKVS